MGDANHMMSLEYFTVLGALLSRIEMEQMRTIREAGKLVASSIARGGILHTFGSGHSHMIAEEAFFRAGGLAPVNAILDERLVFLKGAAESTHAERESGFAQVLLEREDIQPNDAAIIISNSGRNAVPIEMALGMRVRGVAVVAITNLRQSMRSSSRHSSGQRLFEVADLVIDNCVREGDAALDLPGTSQRIGPASTIAGVAIINAIIIEAISGLHEQGLPVPVFSSANVESASDTTMHSMMARWQSRVRLFRPHPDQAPVKAG
jgi:uncharacterized phosphosugar-binding protein